MKNLCLVIILLIFTGKVFAICFSPLSRTNINPGVVPTATKYNADFNDLYAKANELPGDCVADGTIFENKIADGAATTAKIKNASVTYNDFAPGVIPVYGKPIRIRAFTSSGTWIKSIDVGSIFVQVVGGGGASRENFSGGASNTSSSASSFGSHCVGNGGARSANATGASGGTASSGDINLTGASGQRQTAKSCYYEDPVDYYCTYGGRGGDSLLGKFGQGGSYMFESTGIVNSGGGGAGGYCAKIIQRANLADSETVTIGVGGYATGTESTLANPGQNGIVLIYEYEK
jgi:hypothetical protein